jgi:hypothetical protein
VGWVVAAPGACRLAALCDLPNRQAFAHVLKTEGAYIEPSMATNGEDQLMNTNQMRVILGVFSLKAYVTSPKAFHVLGIVRFGQEFGLLATDAQGMYFRVNGSHTEALDHEAVHHAIELSYGVGGRYSASAAQYAVNHPNAAPVPQRVPKVSIRKHRHMDDSTQHAQYGMQAANA